jgi:Ca2+-transporting ATPase
MTFLATQLPSLQRGLVTMPLTGPQWMAAIGLALLLPIVIEVGKALRRRRMPEAETFSVDRAVLPERAHSEVG